MECAKVGRQRVNHANFYPILALQGVTIVKHKEVTDNLCRTLTQGAAEARHVPGMPSDCPRIPAPGLTRLPQPASPASRRPLWTTVRARSAAPVARAVLR